MAVTGGRTKKKAALRVLVIPAQIETGTLIPDRLSAPVFL
jgi:hypothetical protein